MGYHEKTGAWADRTKGGGGGDAEDGYPWLHEIVP